MKNYYFNNRLDVLDENVMVDCIDICYMVINDIEEFKAFCEKVGIMDDGVTSTGMYHFDSDYFEWIKYDLHVYNTLIKYVK